jgi:hypothetical protein
MMIEAIRSSETSVLTKATCRDIPEDVIPHEGMFPLNSQLNVAKPCGTSTDEQKRTIAEKECLITDGLQKIRS